MSEITIKKLTGADIAGLQKIGRETFFETFSAVNTEANMKSYLAEGFSTERLAAELSDENAEFYFACLAGEVIGYLKLNFGQSQTELKEEDALEIERIYVLKAYHGQKVGQLLYEKALEVARQKKSTYIWLGVWEENHKAQSFYRKQGFVEFDKHIFKLGDDEQCDLMMKLDLG